MLARIRKSMEEKDQGFTLIELLVVMIIIGILAAIAIPVFLNQREKSRDTAARADVSTLGKELATYYVDNVGTAPAITISAADQYQMNLGGTPPVLEDLGTTSDNVTGVVTAGNESAWCVQVTYTDGSDTTIAYSDAEGLGGLGSTCNTTTGALVS